MNQHPALRLTPSNSPMYRAPTPKSPSKTNKGIEEPGLRLRKVIGTTTTSSNGFDCLATARQFAYTAGAAAVIATVHDDLRTTQRFFRARPNAATALRETNGYFPVTPTPNDPRNRALGGLRDSGYTASSPVAREWSDSPTGKATTAKERIKAATSVALSPNGKWLAVGESGYKPRVLIFRASDDGPENPVAAVSEHTFGVHALAFSPDSRHLVSLGTVNDGFLYVWSIDDRSGAVTLYASNKCTTVTNCLSWMGRSVVTVGLRFVKVWRPDEETSNDGRYADSASLTPKTRTEIRASDFGNSILTPKHKVLAGKNSLLGELLEANFIAILPFANNRAIICADSGEVCLLDDNGRTQSLTVAVTSGIRVSAARLDYDDRVVLLGTGGQSKSFTLTELQSGEAQGLQQSTSKVDRRKTIMPYRPVSNEELSIVATGALGNTAVELDSKGSIRLIRAGTEKKTSQTVHQLPAHEAAVLVVQPMQCQHQPDAAFFTLSGDGTIQIWDADGRSVLTLNIPVDPTPDAYGMSNELKAGATLNQASVMAVGDRYGVVSILDLRTRSTLTQVRAHSAEVVDIATFERHGTDLVATAGRDRTVQIFAWSGQSLELLQTLDEHAAALNSLLFSSDGQHLLSCSADRTVVVREAMLRDEDDTTSMAFVILRTITLRSSPTSMTFGAAEDTILVSTTDRSITSFNYRTGQTGFGFKCMDSDGGEAAVMSKIHFAPCLNGSPAIIAVGGSDKSVRLYSEVGGIIARDWGHTEGITDVALVQSSDRGGAATATVVTAAADSTIFLWDTSSMAEAARQQQQDVDPIKELSVGRKAPNMAPPLRKVLSHSELFRLRTWREKSLEDTGPSPPLESRSQSRAISPQRTLRKKTSRMSMAQPPRLDPPLRSSTYDASRKKSFWQRSPSPPSPRSTTKREMSRRPSMGVGLRTKSSDSMLNGNPNITNSTGFGSLTSSTESVCRTLRAYRRKLANSSVHDHIMPEAMRELEKELKLTAKTLSQKSQGKTIDEAMMARLLDQASERIVEMLDERLKDRVDGGSRRADGASTPSSSSAIIAADTRADALAGALERVTLEAR